MYAVYIALGSATLVVAILMNSYTSIILYMWTWQTSSHTLLMTVLLSSIVVYYDCHKLLCANGKSYKLVYPVFTLF